MRWGGVGGCARSATKPRVRTAITDGAHLRSPDPRLRRREARHALLVAAAVPRVAPDSVISHVPAAVQHGLPIWNIPLDRVHTSRPRRSGGLRTGRLHVHTAPLGEVDFAWPELGKVGESGGRHPGQNVRAVTTTLV